MGDGDIVEAVFIFSETEPDGDGKLSKKDIYPFNGFNPG